MYVCMYLSIYLFIYLSIYLSIYHIYIYIYTFIYIYIYIYILCFLFIATLSQLIHTMVTLVSHSYDHFQLVLLVETAYTIVNMIKVINKEARAT